MSQIKDALSISEILALNVPGMPTTQRGMAMKMSAESRPFRQRAKRGGGREYLINTLPGEIRAAYAKQLIGSSPAGVTPASPGGDVATRSFIAAPALVEPPSSASEKQRLIRDARLRCVAQIDALAEGTHLSRKKAAHAFIEALTAGRLAPTLTLDCAIANDRNGFKWRVVRSADGHPAAEPCNGQDLAQCNRQLSVGTLIRWQIALNKQGANALVPKHKPRDLIPPPWAGAFLAIMQRPQKPSVSSIVEELRRNLPAGCAPPSLRTVQRWYSEKFSNLDKARGRNTGSSMNPHRFHNHRTTAGMLPMDEVHSDGWGTHFTAPHPISGKFVKLEVWHSHDVASRYVYPPSVGLSESTAVILGSIANVIAADGVPAVWQTDNTGAVKNDRVEFDPAASIAARAGFSIVHNRPGNSQANGIAEEFGHYLDQRARELATYQGRDMDPLTEKRVLKITQKMVAATDRETYLQLKAEAERVGKGIVFESYTDAVAWMQRIFTEYNDRPHRGLPRVNDAGQRRHMTPREMRARFIEQALWQPQPMSIEGLRDLMHPHERKKIIRGTVNLYSQRYFHRDLEHHNGEIVLVAFDINDGSRVWVKTIDGVEICEAKFVEGRSYRPISFMELALEKRADAQQKRLQNKMDDIDRQRPRNLFEEREVAPPPALTVIEGSKPAPAIEAPTTDINGRPVFGDDFTMMSWLASHRDQMDDYDWQYFKERAEVSPTIDREFRRLFMAESPEQREHAHQ